MENAGAITYADRVLLLDSRSATREQRRRLITITSHELAHMWFGDLVTMAWWDDLWLNESFASWMGDKAADRAFPELEIAARSIREAQQAMDVDALPSARAIRQPVAGVDNLLQIADALAYDKGQSVLGMTEAWVGPEAFRKGVLDYLEKHAWGNATAADLWGALGRASGRDVAAVLESFLDQGGVPLVAAEPLPDGRVRLSQSRFLPGATPDATLWRIPVTLDYPVTGGSRRETVLLAKASEVVALPGAKGRLAWVHPNAGESGYYRWRLAPEQIEALAALPDRSLRERMGLIGNLSALLEAGVVHGDAHLRLLARAAADPHPDVLLAVLDGIEHAQDTFAFEAPLPGWAAWVRATLRPALVRIGPAPRPGEPEEAAPLRGRLLAWLALEGEDAEAQEYGQQLARRFLADPAAVDPALVGPALRIAAANGDRALFDTYRARFEAATVPAERAAFLVSLGAFRNPEVQEAALRYSLFGPVRPQEVAYIAFTAGQVPGSRDRVVSWLLENYDAIAARIPAAYLAGAPRLGGGCSLERLARVERFFSDPRKAPKGVEKTLRSMSEAVHGCVALRDREGAAVAGFLARQASAGGGAAGTAAEH
jgi:alanyl aminopeptidase